jgi:hypothetical protein
MIWSEPLGFERWQAITNIMLTHKAHMKGKLPTEVPIYIAEGISQQLQRVVRACPEQQSATLFKDYTSTYSDILNARELCHPVTKEMYTTSNQMFIRQLKRLLDSYTSESIFGHSTSKEHKAPEAVHLRYNKSLGRSQQALLLKPPHHPRSLKLHNWEDKVTKVSLLLGT